jgi:hypothetical protein
MASEDADFMDDDQALSVGPEEWTKWARRAAIGHAVIWGCAKIGIANGQTLRLEARWASGRCSVEGDFGW